jgi:ferredoxin
LEQYQERVIAGLRVRIDKWACVGYGDCMAVAPDVFQLDERNLSSFRDTAAEPEQRRLITACSVCPTSALAVFDQDGTQLVP